MYQLSATQIKDLFVKGEVTAEEIASYFLKRCDHFDKQLGAYLSVFHQRAIKKAKILDNKRQTKKPLGKLAGVPICIKDNQHVMGEKTTCGSKILEHYQAVFDATAISLLEQEDAILIGKNNMDEFAMGSSNEHSAFFPSKNPWDLQKVPGGSSGGSTAAIGARLALMAIGSDTGGSIRQPASFCGVVGFKPTYGRVSRHGLASLASSFDQIGPITTNVVDSCLMMEVIGKHCPMDATSLVWDPEVYTKDLPKDLKGLKIGIPSHFLEQLPQESLEHFEQTKKRLTSLGAKLLDINLDLLDYSIAVYMIIMSAEASTNLARYDGIRYGYRSPSAKTLKELYGKTRDEGFGDEVKNRIIMGTYLLSAGYIDAYYNKAQKARAMIIDLFEKAFAKCDFIAMPTTVSSAFEIGKIQDPVSMYLQDIFTVCANLAGLPAISVPSGFCKDQMPLGLQLLGKRKEDKKVLRAGYAFEQLDPFDKKIPPLFDKEAL